MMEEMERCTNIVSKGVQPVPRWEPMPVYEMTREPKCDRRKRRDDHGET